MCCAEKIGIGALHRKHPDAAGVVVQWTYIKATHARFGKIFAEFGTRFLTVTVDFVAVLADVHDLFRQGSPLQDFIERGDFGRVGVDLRESGHSAQLEAAVLFKNNRGALVRNNRLRGVDDGLQHALQIQG